MSPDPMAELREVLLSIYGSRERVERWLRARGRLDNPRAEAKALTAWHRPTLDES